MPAEEGWRHVRRIFEEAAEKPGPERGRFLDEACAGDAALRADVDALLAADSNPTGESTEALRVGPRAISELFAASREALEAGHRIGTYRLVRVIASGGMGTVYEAVQESPHRTVALKALRIGLSSDEAVRRFRYESELLARLRHPGIAQIHEAGTFREGGDLAVPFFAMEYVEGSHNIVEYARSLKPLSTREILELFASVCEAVQHAHEKGVIHRDLKPGNILVDESGRPKIIDFGIARATGAGDPSSPMSMHTGIGHIIGTPQYMSPEQLVGDPNAIDVRTDIYALGVVLFELLCGVTPYDLRGKSLTELARIVTDAGPKRPTAIDPTLPVELEWIVLKAIEKDAARRYASARDLAADIERFLAHVPVSAGPPSTVYRLKKFVRRHRIFVASGALALLAVVAGVSGISIGLVEARQSAALAKKEAARAETARVEEKKERTAAEEAKAKAEHEVKRTLAVNEFFRDVLRSADPEQDGREAKVVDALARAAKVGLERNFPDDPDIAAELRGTIGNTYLGLGLYDQAEPHLRAAVEKLLAVLGPEHMETLLAENNLASVLVEKARCAEAEAIYRRILEISRRLYGGEHHFTLDVVSNLGRAIKEQGRLGEAEPLYREALDLSRKTLGADDPDTLVSLANLAALLQLMGRFDDAEAVGRNALESSLRVNGEDHPSSIAAMNNLAAILDDEGKLDEAESLMRKAVDMSRRTLGEENRYTLGSTVSLAGLALKRGRVDEAEAVCRQALEAQRRTLGPDSPDCLHTAVMLGAILKSRKHLPEAETLFRETLESRERVLGAAHPDTLDTMNRLALVLEQEGRFADEEQLLRRALDGYRRQSGDKYPGTAFVTMNLGRSLLYQKKYEDAEKLLLDAFALLTELRGANDEITRAAALSLWRLCRETGRADEAEAWRKKSEPPAGSETER